MIFEIPLTPQNRTFSVTIKEETYLFTIRWAGKEMTGWFLDIGYDEDTPIVMGIPLVTGVDLLKQYHHLVPFPLFLWADYTTLPPAFNALGYVVKLYFATEYNEWEELANTVYSGEGYILPSAPPTGDVHIFTLAVNNTLYVEDNWLIPLGVTRATLDIQIAAQSAIHVRIEALLLNLTYFHIQLNNQRPQEVVTYTREFPANTEHTRVEMFLESLNNVPIVGTVVLKLQ